MHNIQYRFQIWSRILGDIIFIIMWYSMWSSLYGEKNTYSGIEFSQTVTYVIATQFLITLNSMGSPLWTMEEKISTGDIVYEFLRPYSFLKKTLSECVASSTAYFLLSSMWVFGATIVVLHIDVPINGNLLFFILSFTLGYLIRFFMELSFSFLSFWLIHIGGIRAIFTFSISVFSGSVVPLWFFPETIRNIAEILPFQYIYYVPCNILVGEMSRYDQIISIVLQIVWILASVILSKIMWKVGSKKVVVQGG